MNSKQFYEGQLVIAKQGTNPWWPCKVARCKKTNNYIQKNEMNLLVNVNFLEINIEAWINTHNILRMSSREKLESHLQAKHNMEGENLKYSNNVPLTMQESYKKAWEKYNTLVSLNKNSDFSENDIDMTNVEEEFSIKEDVKMGCSPCEVCVTKEIEFNYGFVNTRILNLSVIDRSLVFSKVIIGAGEEVFQCDNQCVWKYHSRCVSSNEDLVCSCNKSSWRCSVCDECVTVTQMFMCNNYECMRVYHKSCLAAHIDLQPDMKQCPLHSCVNCRLDDLSSVAVNTPSSSLAYCVKCKLAFHNHRDCLPLSFITITDRFIICGRHFDDVDSLSAISARFCFTCATAIVDRPISCKYCLVTYHNTPHCLPLWVDLIDTNHFICNGCKFPLARRWKYPVLAQIQEPDTGDIKVWKMGTPIGPSNDCKTVVIRDHDTSSECSVQLSRLVQVNLQSLDHLVCFGINRFKDMQAVLALLSQLVSQVATSLNLQQCYRRNAFVLNYSSLFPITENVYSSLPTERCGDGGGDSVKCACTNYCSTSMCANVASKRECTASTCSLPSRCRNMRIQRRHYPRQRLIVSDQEVAHVVLEEAVVKDVLVMELIGEVRQASCCHNVKDTDMHRCFYAFSGGQILDNARYCGLSRFLHHSDSPNLAHKSWSVAGLNRIGLFSCRRIGANERLTVDMHAVLFDSSLPSMSSLPLLVPWTEVEEESERGREESEMKGAVMIDLCGNDNDSDRHRDDDDGHSMMSRRPLCPLCLTELVADYASQRAMIHCVSCYTVHHLHCVYDSLTISKRHCRIEKDPRLMKYVCHWCRQNDL